ncbi:3-oxo-behenoyl-CoA reductase [Aureococcus anophagefferens]|nr:3-oxo-behenoyl-CoA reductase [Aureococcus anophagefferens]
MPSDKKVCVVVGLGNKGIGDHCAKQWAAEGFAVAMLARRAEVLAELEKEIPGSRAFPCDVTDQAQVEATVKRIAAELGPVDVCIYNGPRHVQVVRGDVVRGVRAVLALRPAGLYLFAKAILPGMASRGGGVFGVTGATASWRRSGIALARFLQATGLEVYQRHLGERSGRAAFAKDQHLLRLAVEEKKRVDPHFREVFNEAFGQISYWDETYAKRDSHFDWFVSFDDVASRMRAAEASLPGTVEWHAMDARALTFESESHDAVIDKALLDCVLCSDDKAAAAEVLAEFHRVLRPGGTLVLFSAHTRASLERTFASQAGWCFGHLGIESEDAGKPFLLSVVICEKHAAGVAEKACQAAFEARIEALFGA